ncbi:MAG: hypothetical protein AABP62_28615 [Planctomycetota bacterium]
MPNAVRDNFLDDLATRFPARRKMPGSQSLFDLGNGCRIYLRYSKVHDGRRTFYGLRKTDLRELEGHRSIICFLWDGQAQPLLLPYGDFEDVFAELSPADDGQFKAQIYLGADSTELYLPGAGRFNVESYFGWSEYVALSTPEAAAIGSQLTHSQVQTLLAAIGSSKGHDIWIPTNDRNRLYTQWSTNVSLHTSLPPVAIPVEASLREVDVIWLRRGGGEIVSLFEVEHSTPVYSGLLRFNDFQIAAPTMQSKFSIVSNELRRSLFVRQLNRPTFRASGLTDRCTFLEYVNVYEWWRRLCPTELHCEPAASLPGSSSVT